ncbi:putative calcium-binding protein CML19 [Salvia hispanica]|uniref:putative calcium-binding protein CML19 n=1 Tax=Salvia hispanica TaxID=49212 RepID=UPI002009AECA|nr:putative calcium-binding protein CML19 [Salvia hispanica]
MEAVKCFFSSSPKKQASSMKPKSKWGSMSREEEEMREVFRRFDSDGDGKISAAELRSRMESVGEYMSSEEAEGNICHLDSDNDKMLDMEDFLRMMGGGQEEEDLRAAFGVYEWEGTGRITARSLQRVLGQLGDPRSYDECVAMIGVFDSEGEGGIGFHHFQQMMTPAPAS